MKPILNDPKIAPVEAVLQNAMGDNFVNYTSLLEIVSKHGLTPEWHYYNDGKSWLCKMMYKKKNAFWFSVWAIVSRLHSTLPKKMSKKLPHYLYQKQPKASS